MSNKASNGYFQIWTECDGGRGCEKIASALLCYLNVCNLTGGQRTAWSNLCAGQNKTFFILCLWQYLIMIGRFRCIEPKFPEPGHSFMDYDRDFAHVEQAIKRHDCFLFLLFNLYFDKRQTRMS